MNRFRKVIFLCILAVFMMAFLSACGKKNDEKESDQKGQQEVVSNEKQPELPEGNSVNVKAFKHGTMPIEMDIPAESVITEAEDDILAETKGYMLYVFGMDKYNGAIFSDSTDIIAVLNDQSQKEEAKDILRLKDYTIPQDVEGKIYNSINGVEGFWCPLSGMQFESKTGEKSGGDGFLMIYEKVKGFGVYVILGIRKNSGTSEETMEMLQTCALSLKQNEADSGEYIEWTETLPDGVDAKALFKKETILGKDDDDKGICLYYDEENSGYYLIQHFNIIGNATSKEYLQSIIDSLGKNDGVSFSNIEEVNGKMTYQKATMSYSRDGQAFQEVICVSVNAGGNVWLVDLYGTAEQVKSQEDNLSVLLGSLQED